MVQRIRDFGEGLRHGLGIRIRCRACGKTVIYRASDFQWYIRHGAAIENLTWRCSWCKTVSEDVVYTPLDNVPREQLAQWMPPAGMRRR